MRLSWDKETVLVSDDKFSWTYPMTSSIDSKFFAVIAVLIWSLAPTKMQFLEALLDGYHKHIFASSMGVIMM